MKITSKLSKRKQFWSVKIRPTIFLENELQKCYLQAGPLVLFKAGRCNPQTLLFCINSILSKKKKRLS
jgi:hypothetical protein